MIDFNGPPFFGAVLFENFQSQLFWSIFRLFDLCTLFQACTFWYLQVISQLILSEVWILGQFWSICQFLDPANNHEYPETYRLFLKNNSFRKIGKFWQFQSCSQFLAIFNRSKFSHQKYIHRIKRDLNVLVFFSSSFLVYLQVNLLYTMAPLYFWYFDAV